jgi:hypothetical protein
MKLFYTIKKDFVFVLLLSFIGAHAQAMGGLVLCATSFVINLWKRSGSREKPSVKPIDIEPPHYKGQTIIGDSTNAIKALGFDPLLRTNKMSTKSIDIKPPLFYVHGYGDKNEDNSEYFKNFFKKNVINFNFIDVKNPSIFSHSIGGQKDRNTALWALVQTHRYNPTYIIKNNLCVLGFSRGSAGMLGLLHMVSFPEEENYKKFFKKAGITDNEISALRKALLKSPIVLIHPLLDIRKVTKNIGNKISTQVFGSLSSKYSDESIATSADQFLYNFTNCNPYEKPPIDCLKDIVNKGPNYNIHILFAKNDGVVTNKCDNEAKKLIKKYNKKYPLSSNHSSAITMKQEVNHNQIGDSLEKAKEIFNN